MSYINGGPKVISRKNLPAMNGLFTFPICSGLLLDRLHAPGWVWGIWGTVMAIWWIGSFAQFLHQKEIDIFDWCKARQ